MKIDFTASAAPRAGAIVAMVADNKNLSPTAQRLDRDSGGAVRRAINDSKFKGGKDQTLMIPAPRGVRVSRILLVGIGKPDAYDANAAFGTGSVIYASLGNTVDTQALVAVDPFTNMKVEPATAAAQLAYGAQLRSYRFDKYKTKLKPEDKPTLNNFTVAVRNDRAARAAYGPLGKVAEAIFFTRDLVTEPANIINPKTLADQARTLTKFGVKVEVLDRPKIEKLRMGFLHTSDPATQRRIAEEVQKRIMDLGVTVPLGQYVQPMARRKGVTGNIPSPVTVFWNVEKA